VKSGHEWATALDTYLLNTKPTNIKLNRRELSRAYGMFVEWLKLRGIKGGSHNDQVITKWFPKYYTWLSIQNAFRECRWSNN